MLQMHSTEFSKYFFYFYFLFFWLDLQIWAKVKMPITRILADVFNCMQFIFSMLSFNLIVLFFLLKVDS